MRPRAERAHVQAGEPREAERRITQVREGVSRGLRGEMGPVT